MKVFIVLCALFAIIRASPAGLTFYTAEAPILTQYHSQDDLGWNISSLIIIHM